MTSMNWNLFLFQKFLILVLIGFFPPLLCLLMLFHVLYFSAYYLFGITYSLTYLLQEVLIFFVVVLEIFIRWLTKNKKILWKFSFQIFISLSGRGTKKWMTRKPNWAANLELVKPNTEANQIVHEDKENGSVCLRWALSARKCSLEA